MAHHRHNREGSLIAAAAVRLSDIRVLNIVVLVMTAALLVGYLAVSTQSATRGFTIKALERELAALENEQERLDIEAVTGQSMATIEDRIGDMGFVPVPSVDYVSAAPSSVAVR